MTKQELITIVSNEIEEREETSYDTTEEVKELNYMLKSIRDGYALEHGHIEWLADLIYQYAHYELNS